jgi:NAD(P)H-dependent flavin oxidoreductase YrpB (nitropropane dioxygenase family)
LDVLEAAGSPTIGYPRQGAAWADIKTASDRAGSADATTLWAGQAAALSGDEIGAGEVVAQIMAEAAATLRRLANTG